MISHRMLGALRENALRRLLEPRTPRPRLVVSLHCSTRTTGGWGPIHRRAVAAHESYLAQCLASTATHPSNHSTRTLRKRRNHAPLPANHSKSASLKMTCGHWLACPAGLSTARSIALLLRPVWTPPHKQLLNFLMHVQSSLRCSPCTAERPVHHDAPATDTLCAARTAP